MTRPAGRIWACFKGWPRLAGLCQEQLWLTQRVSFQVSLALRGSAPELSFSLMAGGGNAFGLGLDLHLHEDVCLRHGTFSTYSAVQETSPFPEGLLMLLYVTFPILLNIFLSWRGPAEVGKCSRRDFAIAGRLSSALQGFDFGLVCLCIVVAGARLCKRQATKRMLVGPLGLGGMCCFLLPPAPRSGSGGVC